MNYSFQLAVKRLGWIAFVCVFLFIASVQAQPTPFGISYELTMTNPESHLFEVKMTIEPPPLDAPFDIQMPRWSPGRYAVVDFAKNVQEVRASIGCPANAVDCLSANLPVSRIDTQTWRITANKQKKIVVTYKVFANNLSGTFSQLDARHANYNGGTIFMYVVNHKQDPVQLKITPPANWKIINGRMDKADQTD